MQGDEIIGRVVVSLAGRDAGRSFMAVAAIDAEHLAVADGKLRKIERPKKKKRKHIRIENAFDERIKEALLRGERVLDADIRKSLRTLGYDQEPETKEG